MNDPERLLELLLGLQRRIRDAVVAACARDAETGFLAAVADDGPGDTIYAVDKVSEALLVQELESNADALGGIRLVAEGIAGGSLTLPRGRTAVPAWRVIVTMRGFGPR